MKKLTAMILTGLTLTSLSSLHAETPSETTSEINAQTTITKEHIDNLIEAVSRRKIDSAFNAFDYLNQVEDFKAKVEKSLVKFEEKLEKEILPQVSKLMEQYNAIHKSSMYSDDQKKMILTERSENMKAQFAKLSESYKSSIKEVYALVPYSMFPVAMSVNATKEKVRADASLNRNIRATIKIGDKISADSTFSVSREKVNGQSINIIMNNKKNYEVPSTETYRGDGIFSDYDYIFGGYQKINYVVYDYSAIAQAYFVYDNLFKEVYNKHFYPIIKGSCQSKICLGLRAADYVTLLNKINKSIDRKISMRLADGNYVTLENMGVYIDSDISKLYSRVDYPEELPFDI